MNGGGNPKSGSGWRERLKSVKKRWRESKVWHMLFDSEGVEQDEWVKEMKGNLGLTASIIATLTFQLATNPPGGVVQASLDDKHDCLTHNGVRGCVGEAVLGVTKEQTYLAFLICDTISFLASLHVCILLVSGIPLKGRFLIWLLSMGMWVSVMNLALAYLFAASMVTSSSIWPTVVGSWIGVAVAVWVSVIVISGFYNIVCPPFLRSTKAKENEDGPSPTTPNISKSQELAGRSV